MDHPRAPKQKRLWLKNKENPQMPRSTRQAHERADAQASTSSQSGNTDLAADVSQPSTSDSHFSGLVMGDERSVSPDVLDVTQGRPQSSDEHDSDSENVDQVMAEQESVPTIHEALHYSSSDGEQEEGEEIAGSSDNEEAVQGERSSSEMEVTTERQKRGRKDFNEKIFPGLKKTKFEVYLMSLFLSMRHGYTTVNLLDHFKFVNSIFDSDVIPSASTKVFDNIFKSPYSIEFHFFCPVCSFCFGKCDEKVDSRQCPVCKTVCDGQSNFFIYIPMEQQLRNLLENTPGIEDLLRYRNERQVPHGTISDVYDGAAYKSLSQEGNILSDLNNISLSVGTDGSPVFLSASNSMWPIQFRINELPPNIRFEKLNTLVCGVWFGHEDPKMDAFLAPMVKEANKLYSEGFVWRNSHGINIKSKVVVLNCILDSIAKPKVQNVKQFNGSFSCNYCYHPAFTIPGHPQSRFIMDDNVELSDNLECVYTVTEHDRKTGDVKKIHKVTDRTNNEIRHHMDLISQDEGEEVVSSDEEENDDAYVREKCKHIKGVKGKSPMYFLLYFCLVFGFSLDYLHCVLLGVCKLVTGFHFDREYSSEDFSIRKNLQDVDQRLKSIKPPSSISRRPRTLNERSRWKGNEWRSYLLYYSVPCLSGILKPKYFKHHCLLVTSIFTLLQDKITEEELKTAAWYLTLYVAEFQRLYGPLRMNFNVHLLLHLAKSVSLYGPLWSFSAFTFESGNGFLVRLVKGTREVASQIVKKYVIAQSISEIIPLYTVADTTVEFCNDLMCYRIDKHAQRKNEIVLLGQPKICALSQEEKDFIIRSNVSIPQVGYERLIKKGIKYHAKTYLRQGKTSNDSVAKLDDDSYVVIERIFLKTHCRESESDDDVYLLVRGIHVDCKFQFTHYGTVATVPHVQKCDMLRTFGNLKVVKASSLIKKIVFINETNNREPTYVVDMPNIYEKD